MTSAELYQMLGGDVVNYQQLVNALSSYKKPRDKISRMLASGDLIRLRKGLYIFGEKLRKAAVDRFHLANLMYGPSYVSFETALAYYGLIPERVESIISATTGKNKKFKTPLGLFIYRRLAASFYQEGVTLKKGSLGNILVATPEKALCDQLLLDGRLKIKKESDLKKYLTEDLRIDIGELQKLKVTRLKKIAKASKDRLFDILVCYIRNIKPKHHE